MNQYPDQSVLSPIEQALADSQYHRMLADTASVLLVDRTIELGDALQQKETWMQYATQDDLTGLPNRRLMLSKLDEFASSDPGNFAVAFVDLNGLKRINDTEGHDAGNEMIKTAGSTMDANTRRRNLPTQEHPEPRQLDTVSKITARLSGDEFALILPGVNTQEEVDAWTNRILDELKANGITAAIGARVHRAGESGQDTLKAVDEMMYEHKQAGKRAEFNAMPLRKRVAAKLGARLFQYSGMQPPRG